MLFKNYCYMFLILEKETKQPEWKYTDKNIKTSNYFLSKYTFHINCYEKIMKTKNIYLVNCLDKYLNSKNINDKTFRYAINYNCSLEETYQYDLFYREEYFSNYSELKYLIARFYNWNEYLYLTINTFI